MPKLSPHKVNKTFEDYYLDNLINAFNLCIDRKELKPFLQDLLTKSEIRMLAKRLQIALMLYQGHTYETITNQLKVTNQTISRIAHLFDYGKGGLMNVIQHLYKFDKDSKIKLERGPNLYPSHKLTAHPLKSAVEKSARELLKIKRQQEVKRNIKSYKTK